MITLLQIDLPCWGPQSAAEGMMRTASAPEIAAVVTAANPPPVTNFSTQAGLPHGLLDVEALHWCTACCCGGCCHAPTSTLKIDKLCTVDVHVTARSYY